MALQNFISGVKVKDYTFNLYDNSDVLVQTSGLLLGATPAFEFTGMDNNTTYKVECQVTNQLNVSSISSKVSFTTDYTKPYAPDLAFVRANNITGVNDVDWSAVVTQVGTVQGNYSFVPGEWNNALYLEDGACLIYDLNINLPALFSSVLFIKLPATFSGPIFKFMNLGKVDYEIGYDGYNQKFYYKRGSRLTAGQTIMLPSDFIRFAIRPNSILYEISGTLYEIR